MFGVGVGGSYSIGDSHYDVIRYIEYMYYIIIMLCVLLLLVLLLVSSLLLVVIIVVAVVEEPGSHDLLEDERDVEEVFADEGAFIIMYIYIYIYMIYIYI